MNSDEFDLRRDLPLEVLRAQPANRLPVTVPRDEAKIFRRELHDIGERARHVAVVDRREGDDEQIRPPTGERGIFLAEAAQGIEWGAHYLTPPETQPSGPKPTPSPAAAPPRRTATSR